MRKDDVLEGLSLSQAAGRHLVVAIGAAADDVEALKSFLTAIPRAPGFALILVEHVGEEKGSRLTEALAACAALPVIGIEDDLPIAADRLYVAPPNAVVTIRDERFRVRPSRSASERRHPIDRNIMRMVRRGLSVGLRTAFTAAIRRKRAVLRDIPAVHTAEGVHAVRLTVQPMPELGREDGLYMLIFEDRGPAVRRSEEGAPKPDAEAAIESLEQELLRTREVLERAVQDLEAANEELKSSNEELLSMNEELQSANEELETSKEEVQAVNQALAANSADLENLLRSARIATVFLDRVGVIRGFTPAATEIYHLAPGDIGRSLDHFTHRLRNPPPLPDLAALQAEDHPIDDEVESEDGRRFLRRALPYRTAAGAVDGVVVTFTEVTQRKDADAAVRGSEQMLRLSQAAGRVGSFERDLQTGELRWWPETFAIYGLPQDAAAQPAEVWLKAIHPEDRERVRKEIAEALRERRATLTLDYRIVRPDASVRHIESRGTYLYDPEGRPLRSIGVSIDVTERKQVETALQAATAQAEALAGERATVLRQLAEGVIVTDPAGRITFVNEAAARIHGVARLDVPPEDYSNTYHLFTEDGRPYPPEELPLARAVLRGETVIDERWRIRRPDGSEVLAIGSATPMHDQSGMAIGAVLTLRDDTARDAAERRLREREAELARVQRIGEVGGVEVDLRGGFRNRRSPEYLRLHGLPPDAVNEPHEAWVQRLHPEDRENAERNLMDTLASDAREYAGEYRIIRPSDGEIRWISAKAEIERDLDGEPLRLVGAHIDVTERKRSEEALRESEERFRQLAEALPQIIWVMRPDGSTSYQNRRFRDYHGRDVGPTVEERSAYIHPEDKQKIWTTREEAVAAGRPFDVTVRLRRHDGVYRWHLMWVVPLRQHGAVVSWIGTATDIDDLYQAEAALRESEARLRLALFASGMGDWSWDAKRDFVTLSERATEIFGVAAGAHMRWTGLRDLILPEDAERARLAVEQAIAQRTQFDSEYRIRRASDGASVWVAVKGQATYDAAGQVDGMIGIVQDITARKRDEERQHLLIRELHHRVKNTLATVQAIVGSTARTSVTIDEFYKAFVGRIVSMAHTHSLLTDDEWQRADLRDLLADELRPYDENGERVRLEGPSVELSSDLAVPIGMAIHELTTNAAKYGSLSRRGGRVEVAWTIEREESGRRLRLQWVERGGPPVEPPQRQGFGSRLLQRVLTTQLQAEVSIDFEPEGFRLLMVAPLPHMPGFLNPLLA